MSSKIMYALIPGDATDAGSVTTARLYRSQREIRDVFEAWAMTGRLSGGIVHPDGVPMPAPRVWAGDPAKTEDGTPYAVVVPVPHDHIVRCRALPYDVSVGADEPIDAAAHGGHVVMGPRGGVRIIWG